MEKDDRSAKPVTSDTGSGMLPTEQANPQAYQEWTE